MKDKDIVRSLSHDQRARLSARSDYPAAKDLVLHAGGLAVIGLLIVLRVPGWPLLMLVQGILLVFLFTVFHETMHGTAFRSVMANKWVNRVCGFVLFIAPAWFRYFHLAHHRHTQDPRNDPELATAKPATLAQYVVHLSGIPTHWNAAKTLLLNAQGNVNYTYVPDSASANLRSEARIMLVLYVAVTGIAILLGFVNTILSVWLVPMLLGQPFLRFYLLAEHGLCPQVSDMLDNTRTTFTGALVRRLAWNMPYHTEHHLMPTVPYYKLGDLHQLVGEHLRQVEAGYIPFHKHYIQTLK